MPGGGGKNKTLNGNRECKRGYKLNHTFWFFEMYEKILKYELKERKVNRRLKKKNKGGWGKNKTNLLWWN